MARNAAGTYSKPAGQPVVSGTSISTVAHNALADDIATELTDSLSRSGKGAMLDVLEVVDGVIGGPGVAFASEPTSGTYRAGAGDVRDTVLGADVVKRTAAGVDITGKMAATGAVSGTTGTFSAAVSGTTGTFSGAVAGTTGTFSAGLGDDTSHGNRGGGALHADATGAADGFMPAAHFTLVDGATDAATASTVMKRDANGNAKAATPTDPAHVAIKSYVDGLPRVLAWAYLTIGAVGAVTVTAGSNVASASWATNVLSIVFTSNLSTTTYATQITRLGNVAFVFTGDSTQAVSGFDLLKFDMAGAGADYIAAELYTIVVVG